MKAKKLVAKIAKFEEYLKLVELVGEMIDHPDKLTEETSEEISYLFGKVLKETADKETWFIDQVNASYKPTTIGGFQGATKQIKAAEDAFSRQIKLQMPVFASMVESYKNMPNHEK